MANDIKFRIILEKPPAGVAFGLQKGKGSSYETVQKQTAGSDDLYFEFAAEIKGTSGLLGPYVQGKPDSRFVYLDIGTLAGQSESVWSRRLKIPLTGLSESMIAEASQSRSIILETRVPGTGRDGGPNCATVKPFSGWKLVHT